MTKYLKSVSILFIVFLSCPSFLACAAKYWLFIRAETSASRTTAVNLGREEIQFKRIFS